MGTRGFCDCIDRSYEYFLDVQCEKGKNGAHRSEMCYNAGAMPPVFQSNLKGSKICGQRFGTDFLNAIRPDPVTGKCPDGY